LVEIKTILESFLQERGLELSPTKTKITSIKEGITFLGFDLKKVKYNPQLNPVAVQREKVIRVAASEKGKRKLREKIAEIITKGKKMLDIVNKINPILRG
jgi:RNA-directed DNA polymerase